MRNSRWISEVTREAKIHWDGSVVFHGGGETEAVRIVKKI